MAVTLKAAFGGGELDPALRERTTLQKYDTGLATARNVTIGNSGRIISAPSRKLLSSTKNINEISRIYYPPGSSVYLEFGPLYVRTYSLDEDETGVPGPPGTFMEEYVSTYTADDLPNLRFAYSNFYVYIFLNGVTTGKLYPFPGGGFIATASVLFFGIPAAPTTPVITENGAPTGYEVDYAITVVKGGQESPALVTNTAGYNLPIAAGQSITVQATMGLSASLGVGDNYPTEARIYRRPHNGGAFGYIGSTSFFSLSGPNTICTFVDVGGAADYTHSPPALVDRISSRGTSGIEAFKAACGTVYQQRLVMASGEVILSSRTGYQNNFYRDYPLSDDSSLEFKCGVEGTASIIDMIESEGLIVFTTRGIFLHQGQISPDNLALEHRGEWVIDSNVPPLRMPGGVLFIDSSTNVVRSLKLDVNTGYNGDELSIFSGHLFEAKQVKSWAFQTGDTPLLWVVFEDGTLASLTYESNQEMRAWTRHDYSNDVNVEYVAGLDSMGATLFLVEKDGKRYVEISCPRFVSAALRASDTESDKNESITFMDSLVSWSSLMNDDLGGTDTFTLATITDDDWAQQLTLTCDTSALFGVATDGVVGTVFRFFNPDDQTTVDLTVVSRTSNNEVIVQPSGEFPNEYASGFRLYRTKSTFTGLDHMEGEFPAIVVDGYVVGSPYNSSYPQTQINGGEITLPSDLKGAIVHIGRARAGDIETLDIDTVEQRPVFIESQTVNKVYVKLYRSRGIWVANEFPEDDTIDGMEEINVADILNDGGEDGEVPGNRYIAPTTKRCEVTLGGGWDSNGKICLRGVDPLAFEILSIIPDTDDQRR
jgi:hypothetical protein